MWEPTRDFAFAKIPVYSKSAQNLCGFTTSSHGGAQLFVVTADGSCYSYQVDSQVGGECALIRQDSIMDPEEEGN